jgi:putative SOS response-associated peptidase YedK
MGVLLDPDGIGIWLTGSEDEATALARPWPDGRLAIAPSGDVDWSGA